LRNAVGSIRWSSDPRLHEDRATADSVGLEHSGDGDFIETGSTATRIDPFTRSLPRELTAAGAFWISQLRLEVDWTQGFEEGARITEAPRAALGTSLWRWRRITPRLGIAVGGIDGPVLAGGVRARFWRCSLDLAYQSLGSLHLFLPKGIGVGAALTLHPLGRPPTP
jgi:hypothetical protein